MTVFDYLTTLVQWGTVIGASLAGAVCDTRTHRIPNWLTLPVVAAGLTWSFWLGGVTGLVNAIGGCVLMALPFVFLFIFADGGAGDAKLMGALGAWLGVVEGLVALVAVVVVGAVLAFGYSILKKEFRPVISRIRQTFSNLMRPMAPRETLMVARLTLSGREDMLEMPYGASIFLGVCFAALSMVLWNIL